MMSRLPRKKGKRSVPLTAAVLLFTFVVVVALVVGIPSSVLANNVVHTDVKRAVDVSSAGTLVVREKVELTVEWKDEGAGSTDNQWKFGNPSVYHVTVPASRAKHLALIELVEPEQNKGRTFRLIGNTSDDAMMRSRIAGKGDEVDVLPDMRVFTFQVSPPLKSDEGARQWELRTAYLNQVTPLPHELEQGQPQTVLFQNHLAFISPYPTQKYALTVKLPTNTAPLSRRTKPSPMKRSGSTLHYGPYRTMPTLAEPLSVHFETLKSTGIVCKSWKREVWVRSQGHTLEVEEHVRLTNEGAKLKGNNFNRVKFMENHRQVHNRVDPTRFLLTLPGTAREVYYRDEIGNVSTSHLSRRNGGRSQQRQLLEVTPRYPLFGGWNYNWYHGYAMSATEGNAVQPEKNGPAGRYVLTVPLVQGLYDVAIEELEFTAVLPEGVTDIRVFEGERDITDEDDVATGKHTTLKTTYYYLDTIGRPTVQLHRRHILPEQWGTVRIHYTQPLRAYLQKPLAVAGVLIGLALVAYIWSGIDFSIAQRGMASRRFVTLVQERTRFVEALTQATSAYLAADEAARPRALNTLKDVRDRVRRQLTQNLEAVALQQKHVAVESRDHPEDRVRAAHAEAARRATDLAAEGGDLALRRVGVVLDVAAEGGASTESEAARTRLAEVQRREKQVRTDLTAQLAILRRN